MSKEIKPFCVDGRALTEDQIKELHDMCISAGVVGEDLSTWLRSVPFFPFLGVELDCANGYGYPPAELITFDQVPHYLGLDKEPKVVPEKPSETLQEELSTGQPSCVGDEVKPLTAKEDSFMSVVKDGVLELGIDVSIKSSAVKGIYYEVYHPDFEGGFEVSDEGTFISLVEGFKTLSKFKF